MKSTSFQSKEWFARALPSMPYWLISLAAALPVWLVKHPPLQDVPFHLATIRLLHSYSDPQYGFAAEFVRTLGRTQYLAYYVLGDLLAYPLGVVRANLVLMSVYLAGTPLALRGLLRVLNRDERACLFAIPFLYNVMFQFGLLPFLFGIPILFLALTAAVRHFEAPSVERGAVLGMLALLLFYTHVFPFALFAMGLLVLFPFLNMERWAASVAPLLPTFAAGVHWLGFTEAGKLARAPASSKELPGPPSDSLARLWSWLGDVYQDDTDERLWLATSIVLFLSLALAGNRSGAGPGGRGKRAAGSALVLLVVACSIAYFVLPESRGYYWLFAQRFPTLGLFCAILFVRLPAGRMGELCTAAIAALGFFSSANALSHYRKFEATEVGELDEAISKIPERSRVAALIYDKGSSIFHWVPFLHFGSYYQVARGGVLQFSYVGYAHWPIDYRAGHYPPPGTSAPLRWEWTPEHRTAEGELYPYYSYILTRGEGFRPNKLYRIRFQGPRWAVWEKAEKAPALPTSVP